MVNIAVLASGRGSNLQAIINAIESGKIKNGQIKIVISDREDAYALKRAKKHNIKAVFIDPKNFPNQQLFEKEILNYLKKEKIDLVLLAGFMRILSPEFVREYPNRIMNIHPSLLPAFGGKGFYGLKVHQAVLDAGVKYTGCTVHFVTEECDKGPIILQEVVKVKDNDTPETLARRVLRYEHKIYPAAVKLFCDKYGD